MKQFLSILCIFFTLTAVSAQYNVSITIEHKLGLGTDFEMGLVAQNNLDLDFSLERLEYYISKFEIVHDGGQVITFDDLYVLVDLNNKVDPTVIDFGVQNVDVIEEIRFNLGIDEETNHADPSLWPEGHPLAPKSPSMHWGWAAGYRFIALEGQSLTGVDGDLQFHCIGDEFYKTITTNSILNTEGGYEAVFVADYTDLLKDVDFEGGMILHGNLDEIKTVTQNFIDNVFQPVVIVKADDLQAVENFEIFPNPSLDGIFSLDLKMENQSGVSLKVMDAMGKTVWKNTVTNNAAIQLNNKGIYVASLLDANGNVLRSKRLIVQ